MFWKINAEVSTWFWDIITVAGAGKKAKNDYKPAKKFMNTLMRTNFLY